MKAHESCLNYVNLSILHQETVYNNLLQTLYYNILLVSQGQKEKLQKMTVNCLLQSSVSVLCQLKIRLLCSLTVNSVVSFIHSFILNIYIAPLQENYSEAQS